MCQDAVLTLAMIDDDVVSEGRGEHIGWLARRHHPAVFVSLVGYVVRGRNDAPGSGSVHRGVISKPVFGARWIRTIQGAVLVDGGEIVGVSNGAVAHSESLDPRVRQIETPVM